MNECRIYLTVARLNRSQVSLYVTAQDEDGEETGEDVTKDDSWDYAAILWNGAQAEAVQFSFEPDSVERTGLHQQDGQLLHRLAVGPLRAAGQEKQFLMCWIQVWISL